MLRPFPLPLPLIAVFVGVLGCRSTAIDEVVDAAAPGAQVEPAPWEPHLPGSDVLCWTPKMGRRTRESALPPCTPSREPCNFLDDDGDGITDPSCKTMPCHSHADCTYHGAHLGDDCDWPAGGVCNTIHAPEPGVSNDLCAGVACPPAMQCVAGACSRGGATLPGEPCFGGAECALSAGCIPWAEGTNAHPSDKRCVAFCHDYDCPAGFVCSRESYIDGPQGQPEGDYCRNAALCLSARKQCTADIKACFADAVCVQGLAITSQCLLGQLKAIADQSRNGDGGPSPTFARSEALRHCIAWLPRDLRSGSLERWASCNDAACEGDFTQLEVF